MDEGAENVEQMVELASLLGIHVAGKCDADEGKAKGVVGFLLLLVGKNERVEVGLHDWRRRVAHKRMHPLADANKRAHLLRRCCWRRQRVNAQRGRIRGRRHTAVVGDVEELSASLDAQQLACTLHCCRIVVVVVVALLGILVATVLLVVVDHNVVEYFLASVEKLCVIVVVVVVVAFVFVFESGETIERLFAYLAELSSDALSFVVAAVLCLADAQRGPVVFVEDERRLDHRHALLVHDDALLGGSRRHLGAH